MRTRVFIGKVSPCPRAIVLVSPGDLRTHHMTFNFHSRYGLFTFAQCADLDPFEVVNHFASLNAECIIGREDHADGGTHLHCFVDFGRKYRSRRSDAFDVGGRHPNIVSSRGTPEKGWDYATKDGNVVAGGLDRPSGSGHHARNHNWAAITSTNSADEFWAMVLDLEPRAAACSFSQLERFAAWKFRPAVIEYQHPSSIEFLEDEDGARHRWLSQSGIRGIHGRDEQRSK